MRNLLGMIFLRTTCTSVARASHAGSLPFHRSEIGNTQDPVDTTFDTLVGNLFDRALEGSTLHHGMLDRTAHGKSSHLALPAQTGARPLRAPHVAARGATVTVRPLSSFSSFRARPLRRDMSMRTGLEETLKDIDLILGTTTTAPTTTRSTAQPAAEQQSFSGLLQNKPKLPGNSFGSSSMSPRKQGPPDLKESVIGGAVSFINAYQGVMGIRFVIDWLTLLGVRADEPPWGGFRLLTDPYLNLFAIFGPFSFIAGYYVLTILRDYLNSQR